MNNISLQEKTTKGLFWSLIENLAQKGIVFIVSIVLARLLEPEDFGLIGMITIFFAISQSLIDSGFTQALIRKSDCNQEDYSTVFYFNLLISLAIYVLLFLLAKPIANFYSESQLENIIKVLAISLIINAFFIVQKAQINKTLEFKKLTIITLIATISSGSLAIILAYKGFGVWSLVVQNILTYGIRAVLLWFLNSWRPILVFSKRSFFVLFSFGSKLMISGLIDTIYRNIYLLVIGKYFSAAELGYYTRADQFKNLPSENIMGVIQRVTFPVLSIIQKDTFQLKTYYRKMTKGTMFITFFLMMSMAGCAEQMILFLIGEKWLESVLYLQLLCFVGIFFPLEAINLNILKVLGHSSIVLRLEVIKKIIAIPIIVIGVLLGIRYLIFGLIIHSCISYFINSHFSGKMIGYSVKRQVKDILPSFFLSIYIGIILFLLGRYLNLSVFIIFIIQIITAISLMVILSELFAIKEYIFMRELIMKKILNHN